MNDESRLTTTLPIAHRWAHDRARDWVPLERFADLATRSGRSIAVRDFMWMSAAEFSDGRTVHSYKHSDTRRYLHLDESGHAYRYLPRAEGGRYIPCADPRDAIEQAINPRRLSR